MLPTVKKIRFIILLSLLSSAYPSIAEEAKEECVPPEAPAILDGRSARKEQIQDMREAVEAFIVDNFSYRECLQEELKIVETSDSPRAQAAKAFLDEAILDSLEMDDLVADTFNTQLRIYKSLKQ